jgi:hypothetical protein
MITKQARAKDLTSFVSFFMLRTSGRNIFWTGKAESLKYYFDQLLRYFLCGFIRRTLSTPHKIRRKCLALDQP